MRENWSWFDIAWAMFVGGYWLPVCVMFVTTIGVPLVERALARHPWKSARIALTCLIATYAFWAGPSLIADVILERRLAAFDLDGDGFLSGAEITPAQAEAMNRLIWDTGRALAIASGLIAAPLAAIASVAISRLLSRVWPRAALRSR